MSRLLVSVLPFALGAAVSPTLLTLELLILTGPVKRKMRSWMFVLGAAVTIFLFGVFAATALQRAGDESPSVSPWTIAVEALVALALLALGVRQLLPARTAAERHHSSVANRIQSARTPVFFVVGVVAMLANFSTLVLYLPAVHIIVHSDATSGERWTAALLLWIITILPLILPVLAVSIVGHRSDALLARLNSWTTRHSRQINAGLCLLFAALIGYSAVKDLLG